MDYTIIGIDVSKNTLDVCILPGGDTLQVPNDKDGHKIIAARIKKLSNVKILLESTGCYHQNAYKYFAGLGLKACVLNPKQVRDYAKSCGRLAKTDKIDAYMIARYGETHDVRESDPESANVLELKALVGRRRQMSNQMVLEKQHLEKASAARNTVVTDSINAAILFYKNQIQTIEKEIMKLIRSDADLAFRHKTLTEVVGVGLVTSMELMSGMPELGRMNKREAAALAGLAPMNCDSGGLRGQRHIQGGRQKVRDALYMASVSGLRNNSVIKAYYEHLVIDGKKPFKVAIVACMRKLLLHLNSICADKNLTL